MTLRKTLIVSGFVLSLASTAAAAEDGSALRDFGWSWFNLIILGGVILYFARKAVPALMAVRYANVKNEIDAASQLLEEADSKFAEWQSKIEQLDQEVEQIRADSLRLTEAEKERILAQARQTAERIREEGKLSIARAVENARSELRTEAADLAIEFAREILARQVNDADRANLLDGFIQGLESASTTEQRG